MASSVPFFHSQARPLQARVVCTVLRQGSCYSPIPIIPWSSTHILQLQWSENDQCAVNVVQRGEMSIHCACEEYWMLRSSTRLQESVAEVPRLRWPKDVHTYFSLLTTVPLEPSRDNSKSRELIQFLQHLKLLFCMVKRHDYKQHHRKCLCSMHESSI